MRRTLYRRPELLRLFHPRSIAIVGASARAGSFGHRTMRNLLDGFDGELLLVNPKGGVIEGRAVHASVADLPSVPDCAVLMVARDAVDGIVAECVAAGVGGIVLSASGYAETGQADLVRMQDALVARVSGAGTRLLGPNSLGITNYVCGARMTFGRMPDPRPLAARSLGIVAQSGAIGMALAQSMERGVSVSHVIMVGNAADVDIADSVAYLADEPACGAIACVLEGMPDPGRLVAAARLAAAATKPLIVYKMATGQLGAAAAISHTGAMAGADVAYRATLEAAGAVMVPALEDVIETAMFFAKAGRPKATGVAVVVTSGGAGVIAADKAEAHGVALPQPQGETHAALRAAVPAFGAARNPCDVTAQALSDEGPLAACASALLADPAYGALVVAHAYADPIGVARLPLWTRLSRQSGKIICNYWFTEYLEGPGAREIEADPHQAIFRSMDRCMAAIAAWHRRETALTAPAFRSRLVPLAARGAARERLRLAPNRNLTEREAKDVLAYYGVPVVAEMVAHSADAATEAAVTLGFPVAMKAESPDIPHKTEAGVVRLGVATPEEARAAFADIMERALLAVPADRINGVLVQPMVPPGVDIVVGATVDTSFGPLLMVGLGGIFVELLRDTVTRPAPVSPVQAQAMLRALRGAALLGGFRGVAPVAMERLADVISRISELVADAAELIAELDINPIVCAGDDIRVVDALIVRRA